MGGILKTLIAGCICATATLSGPLVQQASAHEDYFRNAPSAECSNPLMLKRIMKRFKIQARDVHHNESLQILEIHGVDQTRYLPQDVHLDRPVARRYCKGHVHLSDGRKKTLWYLIEGGAGFASVDGNFRFRKKNYALFGGKLNDFGSNVEFCISGMDDWNVYDAHCRVLR